MITIRTMGGDDCPSVLALEAENLSPWTQPLLAAELTCKDAILLVAEDQKKIVGWLGARVIPPEAELLKIAVQQEKRRMGIAGKLLSTLCHRLLLCGCEELFLEVRSQNIGGIEFYLAKGFAQVGQRVLYYSHPDDDALVLKKQLASENNNFNTGKCDENT